MAIIGLSGKIGSGKNTVANIITNLLMVEKGRVETGEVDYFTYPALSPTCGWEVKSFAFKLKKIVSILTGCNVADLESQEFKNSKLPELWNIEQQAYETQSTQVLMRRYHFDDNPSSWESKGIYEEAKKGFLEQLKKDGWSYVGSAGWSKKSKFATRDFTYREVLQKIGTEVMRQGFHSEVWVNALFADYTTERSITEVTDTFPNWIITDVRFPNEAESIKKRNGILIRVNRPIPNINDDNVMAFALASQAVNKHSSETALDVYNEFDYTIDNDGSLEELKSKAEILLSNLKLL